MISLENLKLRAEFLAKARGFFAAKKIMEVETPLLAHCTITDPNIQSFSLRSRAITSEEMLYLQTSPEFAMKRLIANGSGPIFQISKAFRREECGKLHNAEFTILEWYHLSFDHHNLMDEVDEFLAHMLNLPQAERLSYREAFSKYLAIDPIIGEEKDFRLVALTLGLNDLDLTRDGWLNILFAKFIEPKLGMDRPTFIYDFPLSQAALARVNQKDPRVASRFEVFIKGIELGNGFHELNNSSEQRQRFLCDLRQREQLNLPSIPLDERFLRSLNDLPDCSGIAFGFDRLLMVAADAKSIKEVLAFSLEDI